MRIGFGCMRLSTPSALDELRASTVVHAALDAGVTLLDTADVYCADEAQIGQNERLVARALAVWAGDRSRVQVATKGGLTRPGGRWVPDGRARHLHRGRRGQPDRTRSGCLAPFREFCQHRPLGGSLAVPGSDSNTRRSDPSVR